MTTNESKYIDDNIINAIPYKKYDSIEIGKQLLIKINHIKKPFNKKLKSLGLDFVVLVVKDTKTIYGKFKYIYMFLLGLYVPL